MAYVIMHNLIIDDGRDQKMEPVIAQPIHVLWRRGPIRHGLNFEYYVHGHKMIRDERSHYMLRNDLMERLWALKGNLKFTLPCVPLHTIVQYVHSIFSYKCFIFHKILFFERL